MKTARTTIELDRELLKTAKQKAIEEDKTFKNFVAEAVKEKLQAEKPEKEKVKPKKFPFKAWHMGKIKGTLRRVEIYDWL